MQTFSIMRIFRIMRQSKTADDGPYGPSRIGVPMADRPIHEIESKVAIARKSRGNSK